MTPTPSSSICDLITLAISAGREIMNIYATDFEAKYKGDLTPVTEADEAAEKIIVAGLARLDGSTPVIAEETAAAGHLPPSMPRFYLVDPLDGTREFLNRNGEFTVNIALIENGVPVSGVVYAPALGRLFWGELGAGAAQTNMQPGDDPGAAIWASAKVRTKPKTGLTVVASRSHRDAATEAFLKTVPVASLVSAGSSLKFCLVATGEADLYPRFGRTMEWDTAAGQAVLLAAGGSVVTETGEPLIYGKSERGYDNPGFIARGGA